MNLTAYTYDGKALFSRNLINREQARREVLNHNMLFAIDYVIFKRVRYSIGEVYTKWPTKKEPLPCIY